MPAEQAIYEGTRMKDNNIERAYSSNLEGMATALYRQLLWQMNVTVW
jgi:hypothetical protein